MTMEDFAPIPGPPPTMFLGNLPDINVSDFVGSMERLSKIYGPVFKITLGGEERLIISTQELLNEVCDEKRFAKLVSGPLMQIRNGVADGLFTAKMNADGSMEHNWDIAHRVLMPAFGPLAIRSMFDEMHDIASQLVVKWARFGPKERINVTDDMTRLTLDSIALCAMDKRFNSFYHEEMHPFVNAMVGLLKESGWRARRPAVANYLLWSAQAKYDADIALLKEVATEVVAERTANPSQKKDLLNAMIQGRDSVTGEGLTQESILNNMITFLIAGHETTSALLSFLFYNLLKNPVAYKTAQQQVDEAVGRGPITVNDMSKFPYIEACLRETLRLQPTAPVFVLQPRPEAAEEFVTLGGKYKVKKGTGIVALLTKCHRDPAVFGEDADSFRPERMLDEPFSKLPPNSWKPFGNGMRGCIGRAFAWQESILTVALLLQTFNFRFEDPAYQLEIVQALSLKPDNLFMYATLREHIDPVYLEKSMHMAPSSKDQHVERTPKENGTASGATKEPMAILYGSNAGTCEALAQDLARVAGSRGYLASVAPLDSAVEKLPRDWPVVIISSSYEGQPPHNAAHFIEWIQELNAKELEGVKYAVFGVGSHDWVSTFHKVPKLLDSALQASGGSRIASVGLSDVASGDVFEDFDKWQDEELWASLGGSVSEVEPELSIEFETQASKTKLRQDVKEAVVVSNTMLTTVGVPEKRHIELKLPDSMTYNAGDYMAILPMNNERNIRRVLKHFGLTRDATFVIKAGNTILPTGHPISANDVLASYLEICQPATRKNVVKLANSATDTLEKKKLLALAGDNFAQEVTFKRVSCLDLLEQFPSANLPFSQFLAMLPPMRIRQYSISSSPLEDPTIATLTWSVIDTPSKANKSIRFQGVASNYLSSLEAGDRIHVATKPSHGIFHPPADIENTPMLMFCAGSGLAPFIGFVQERAVQSKAERKLAPAYLFIGCTSPDQDALFYDKLEAWENEGIVKVYYAYSKAKEQSKGARYVQDRLWEEREEVMKVFEDGAKVFVCGSSLVGEGVAAKFKMVRLDWAEARDEEFGEQEVQEWFEGLKAERYAQDIFV